MASITVQTGALVETSIRAICRDSNGRIYVAVNDGGTIRMMRGDETGDTPTGFTEQDTGNRPEVSTDNEAISACMDSVGLIHVMHFHIDKSAHGADPEVRYSTFRSSAHATSQDVWATVDEQIANLDLNDVDSWLRHMEICVDANDDPHATWLDKSNNMGSGSETVYYDNRIGGAWGGRIQIVQESVQSNSQETHALAICVGQPTNSVGADRPIIVAGQTTTVDGDDELSVHHGTALNAIAFTSAPDFAGENIATSNRMNISIGTDDNDDVWVSYSEFISADLKVIRHLATQATWTTWETPVVVIAGSYAESSLTFDGNDKYIFVRRVSPSAGIYLHESIAGGAWAERTGGDFPLTTGVNASPMQKGGKYGNNAPKSLCIAFDNSSDVLFNQENVASGTAVERTASQTLTQSDTVARIKGAVRVVSQSLTESDVVDRGASTFERTGTTVLVQSDAVARIKGAVRTVSQTITESDAVARIKGAVRTATQAITQSQTVDRGSSTFSRTATQTITQSDIVARILGAIRTAVQTITESDSVTRQLGKLRTASQTITQSDTVARIKGAVRTVSQTITESDSVLREGSTFARTVAQAITESDVVTRIKGAIRTATQTITQSDSVDRGASTFERTASQTLTESDVVARIKGAVRTAIQTITESDSVVAVKGLVRTATQTITESDSVARIKGAVRTVSQIITQSDSVARIAEFSRTASQTLTESDVVVAVKGLVRTAVQTITESDSVVRVIEFSRTVTQTITESDTVARILAHIRTAVQTITESDIAVSLKQTPAVSKLRRAIRAFLTKRTTDGILSKRESSAILTKRKSDGLIESK